jgi:ribosomal protein S18 acetylase RimI-like enzyme
LHDIFHLASCASRKPGNRPVIRYRSFRNNDVPQLVDIWRSQPPQRGLAQPMSVELFEQLVLSRPYFENQGLIVALDDNRAIGFAHAGFGPTDDESTLSRDYGVISMLLLRPEYQQLEIGRELLAACEAHLTGSGAKVLYAGGIRPLAPFYFGLYGGSELPGVLASETFSHELYRASQYREIDRVVILRTELARFRAPVDRVQMQIRRTYMLVETPNAPMRSWWEACALERFDVARFDLAERNANASAATARFWIMETVAGGWGAHAAGLLDLEVASPDRRRGLATFLVSESLRRLSSQGIAIVEVQTMAANSAARKLYQKLGFQEVDEGIVYRKQADGA